MTLLKSFKNAAILACGIHCAAGGLGLAVVAGNQSKLSEKFYVPESALSSDAGKSLRAGIETVLQYSSAQHIVLGDNNHCDMRAPSLLADPQMLTLLEQYNVKQIFLEYPPAYQTEFDAIANNGKPSIQELGFSPCGDQIGGEGNRLTTMLIRNAGTKGIRVYAADVNNGTITTLLAVNMTSAAVESFFLHKARFPKFAAWWLDTVGISPLTKNRTNDRSVAAFIQSHTPTGERSLTLRGDAHIAAVGDNTLRANLPQNLTFSFLGSERDQNHSRYSRTQPTTETVQPQAFNPPDYLLNLVTGAVDPYPRRPSEKPLAYANRPAPTGTATATP